MGPIPWSRIVQYADVHGLDHTTRPCFLRILRELDEMYLKDYMQMRKKAEKKAKQKPARKARGSKRQ